MKQTNDRTGVTKPVRWRPPPASMTTSELKAALDAAGVGWRGCIEKDDLVRRLARTMPATAPTTAPPAAAHRPVTILSARVAKKSAARMRRS